MVLFFGLLRHLICFSLGAFRVCLRLAFCPFRIRTHLVAFDILDSAFCLALALFDGRLCLSFDFLHRR